MCPGSGLYLAQTPRLTRPSCGFFIALPEHLGQCTAGNRKDREPSCEQPPVDLLRSEQRGDGTRYNGGVLQESCARALVGLSRARYPSDSDETAMRGGLLFVCPRPARMAAIVMSEITALLLDVFVMYAAARAAGELFERTGQPAVLGELIAGILIGPHALGLIGHPGAALIVLFHGDAGQATEALHLVHELLAELSVVVLLFFAGLSTRIDELLSVGGRALLAGVLGIAVPLALGFALMRALGYPSAEALFVGTALVATSVGITARVLQDLGVLESREARIILGAAVIDDVLGLILLAITSAVASTGTVSPLTVAVIAVQAIGFTGFAVLIGLRAIRRFDLHLERLRVENAPLSVALLAMLGLAVLASYMGLAGIIGAFLAGMIFAEARQQALIREQALPIYQFLAPFFFVITGSQMDWRLLLDGQLMLLALGVTAVAIAGKLIGCGLPILSLGRKAAAVVGVGMVPRGEVGLIVASLGLRLGAFPMELFNVIVLMSVLTTLVAPVGLRLIYNRSAGRSLAAREKACG